LLTSARGANILKIRNTPRTQALSSPQAPHRPRKGEQEHTHRQKVEAHVEEDRTESRLTHAEKERVQRKKERRNGGRAIRGRGIMERNGVGGKNGRSM